MLQFILYNILLLNENADENGINVYTDQMNKGSICAFFFSLARSLHFSSKLKWNGIEITRMNQKWLCVCVCENKPMKKEKWNKNLIVLLWWFIVKSCHHNKMQKTETNLSPYWYDRIEDREKAKRVSAVSVQWVWSYIWKCEGKNPLERSIERRLPFNQIFEFKSSEQRTNKIRFKNKLNEWMTNWSTIAS